MDVGEGWFWGLCEKFYKSNFVSYLASCLTFVKKCVLK